MSHNRLPRRGITLAELLVSILIASLFVGTISALLITSMRIWRECSIRGQVSPPASIIIYALNKDIRDAMTIQVQPVQVFSEVAPDTEITIVKPRTDEGRVNIVDPATGGLEPGYRIKYYLSRGKKYQKLMGKKLVWIFEKQLWRVKLPMLDDGTPPLTAPHLIADNVTSLTCIPATTGNGRVLTLYTTAVTLMGSENATSTSSTFSAQIAFRNDL